MYVPPRYRETDNAVIDAVLREHGFMTVITSGSGGLMASHVPIELAYATEGTRLLRGHLSRANPQWKELRDAGHALVVCLGPHAYISPTWYDHPNVPTWNYVAVHASGPVSVVEQPSALLGEVRRLSEHYEPTSAPPPRFDVDAMPDKLRESELKGIVGFEVRVTHLDAAFKLSQNRNGESHAGIQAGLEAHGDDMSRAVAAEMRAAQERKRAAPSA